MKQFIFSDPVYEAYVVHRPSDTIVVSFAERKEPAPAGFFAEGLLSKTDYAFCCVRSKINDWYVGRTYDACLEAISQEVSSYKRVVIYGNSMGSYGALLSAKALRADRVIVAGPIANIHPSKDRRWIGDYEGLIDGKSVEDLGPQLSPGVDVICVYDPKGPDKHHVRDLEGQASVREVLTPRAGHMALKYLNNGGVLGDITRMLLGKDLDLKVVQSLALASKKKNSYYVAELARALSRHKILQRMLLRYAAKKFPEDIAIRLDHAGAISESGNTKLAAKIIRETVEAHPNVSLGVPLIRALVQYAENGGDYSAVSDLIAPYAGSRARSREAQLLYSRFLRHMKMFDEAFQAHESFMKGGPFSAQGFFERGLIYEELKLPYLAKDSYRKALEEHADFPRARQRLRVLEKMNPASETAD